MFKEIIHNFEDTDAETINKKLLQQLVIGFLSIQTLTRYPLSYLFTLIFRSYIILVSMRQNNHPTETRMICKFST